MEQIKVSILCLAYNHEKHIRNALDGFVMQKTDFPFEVLIHDDASTDKTAEIIKEYEEKYPNIIKPIYQTQNQYSMGVKISRTYLHPRVRGKYIAWCEGDDCWTDPLKLQKQVDFLDSNDDYSVCGHRVCVNDLSNNIKTNIPAISNDRDYSADEIIRAGALFQLSSIMYRTELFFKKPKCFDAKGFGDIQLYIYGAICGKFRVLKDVMSTYNYGTSGSWTERVARNKEKNILHSQEKIRMLERVNEYYDYVYNDSIIYAINRAKFNIAYEMNDKKEMKRPEYKEFYKARKKLNRTNFLKKHFPFLAKIKHLFKK
ncbi:MAG: glycosyltransferase family 2 protein [Clostridia bacterium]|nr:glycosyltransferase family 2 protein [Clostridia bacterium]